MPARILPLDDRTPVLVGVGAWPGDPNELAAALDGHGTDHIRVMVAASRRAVADSGRAAALAQRIGLVAVTEGSWSAAAGGSDDVADPAAVVASLLGLGDVHTVRVDVGVAQCTPVMVAAQRISDGELDAALIVGGEAKATSLRLARGGHTDHSVRDVVSDAEPVSDVGVSDAGVPAGDAAVAAATGASPPDEHWRPTGELMAAAEIEAGLWDPVQQYACIDNALAHAHGLDRATQLQATAELWRRFNRVAGDNPLAWFPQQHSTEFLRDAGPGNRPLSDPYAKWHSTQWAVDQGAALVLCAAGVARDLGVDPSRIVYPQVMVESSDAVSLSLRSQMHRWPAMGLLGDRAAAHLGRSLAAIDLVELYSCFPSAVKVQMNELGLPEELTPTITGGMPFAGGPFNNFTYQATAAVAARLRRDGGDALVTTVSGLLTKPGLAVWSSTPPPAGVLVGDVAAEARAVTDTVRSTADHVGGGTIATCTVTYRRGEPDRVMVIADLGPSDGTTGAPTGGSEPNRADRWVGEGLGMLEDALQGTVIGRPIAIDRGRCRLVT